MLLEIENISKKYSEQWALRDINLSFEKGRVVGLLGPNGAGKSTLMKILTGYICAESGSVRLDGETVTPENTAVKRNIGYLPEHNPLYMDMYVREYLEFTSGIYGMKGKTKAEKAAQVIEKTGLTPEYRKRIGQLSKGYRQRVGLAAAIIHSPKLLILDEPTTGLDPNQLVEIRSLIGEIGKESLVLFSTHIMQEVEMLCDDIVVLNHGKTMVKGTKADLTAQYGTIENMFIATTK